MGEIKTKQTAAEAVRVWEITPYTEDEITFSDSPQRRDFLGGWDAALASVEPGGRFEVGDRVLIRMSEKETAVGYLVERIPQTVDLTVEEKVASLSSKFMGSLPTDERIALLGIATELANGKPIDELCKEYGIATVREVS